MVDNGVTQELSSVYLVNVEASVCYRDLIKRMDYNDLRKMSAYITKAMTAAYAPNALLIHSYDAIIAWRCVSGEKSI